MVGHAVFRLLNNFGIRELKYGRHGNESQIMNMKEITAEVAIRLIQEEQVKNVFLIIQRELGYSYAGFEKEKTGVFTQRNCGMRFKKSFSSGVVEVVIGFYRPYYGVRSFNWRSKSLDVWSKMNSLILEQATKDERADGRTEYITSSFPTAYVACSKKEDDFITYVSSSSLFSYVESTKDHFTDETQEVKRLI